MTEQVQLMSDEAKRVYVRAHGMLPHEVAYMLGEQKPMAGSVLTSTSIFRNSPLFCHALLNMSLRRAGDDVAITYDIPDMVRGIADVQETLECQIGDENGDNVNRGQQQVRRGERDLSDAHMRARNDP